MIIEVRVSFRTFDRGWIFVMVPTGVTGVLCICRGPSGITWGTMYLPRSHEIVIRPSLNNDSPLKPSTAAADRILRAATHRNHWPVGRKINYSNTLLHPYHLFLHQNHLYLFPLPVWFPPPYFCPSFLLLQEILPNRDPPPQPRPRPRPSRCTLDATRLKSTSVTSHQKWSIGPQFSHTYPPRFALHKSTVKSAVSQLLRRLSPPLRSLPTLLQPLLLQTSQDFKIKIEISNFPLHDQIVQEGETSV